MSQREMILDYLSIHKTGLTSAEALTRLGVSRLAARVCDLRKAGHGIVSVRESRLNRYGKRVFFDRYFLGENYVEGDYSGGISESE